MFCQVFIILKIILLCSCDCPITYYPKRVTIGYIHAEINEDPSRHGTLQQYTYPLVEPLLVNKFEAVIGVNGFEAFIGQILDFEISVKNKDHSHVGFGVVVNGKLAKWKILKFNFLVSQSSSFHMGVESITQLMITPIPYKYRVVHQLKNNFKINQNSVLKVFICGLYAVKKQSDNPNYDIPALIKKLEGFKKYAWNVELLNKFKKILRDQTYPSIFIEEEKASNGLLVFNIQTSTRVLITKLIFSFLIFTEKEKKFQYIHDDFLATDSNTYFFDPIKYTGMILTGLKSLKYVSNSQFTLELNQGINEQNSKLYFQTYIRTIENDYQIGYFGIHLIPGLECIDCPSSSYIFQSFCVSQCPFGYVVGRNQYSSYVCQECEISKLFIPKNGRCQCAEGHYLQSPTRTCLPCPYDCLTCSGSKCLTCDSHLLETRRTLNQYGRCTCPQYGYYDDTVNKDRDCQPCYYSCRSCYGKTIKDCIVCQNGRVMSSDRICICDNNFEEDEYGNCGCFYPNYIENGICVYNSTSCGENEVFVNRGNIKRCECLSPAIKFKNKCILCQQNESFDYGFEKCVCNKGAIEQDGKCTTCKENQIYNSAYKTCDCHFGFHKDKNGNCISCPPQTHYDIETDKCECIFNYFKMGQKCFRCTNPNQGASCQVVEYSNDPFHL